MLQRYNHGYVGNLARYGPQAIQYGQALGSLYNQLPRIPKFKNPFSNTQKKFTNTAKKQTKKPTGGFKAPILGGGSTSNRAGGIRRKKKVFKKKTKLSRKALLNILTVPNYWTRKDAEEQTVANSTTSGQGSIYWIARNLDFDQSAQSSAGALYSVANLANIASQISSATGNPLNLKYTITDAHLTYELMNFSQGKTNLEVWTCKFREDLPTSFTSFNNILTLLNSGFVNNGYTSGLTTLELTPFQSKTFCEIVKIVKTQKFVMEGGSQLKLRVGSTKSKVINMAKFYNLSSNAGVSYATTAPVISYLRGSTFLLFRASGQIADNSGGVTFTAPKIGCSYTYTYEYKWMEDKSTNIVVKAPDNIFSGTGAYNIVLDATDAIADPTNA